MRKYAMLPIARLVSDVAVDPVHVRELADSIKVSGPIAPVLVREDTMEVIDGFHRVAALNELGFLEVESILTPCDDEAFWDLRIMSATLHKSVTFARAVDWIEQGFVLSPWAKRYKSAYSLFHQARVYEAPPEARAWANAKAQKWGLTVQTIENWLHAKQGLSPDLFREATASPSEEGLDVRHYITAGRELPGKPEFQRAVIDKARREELPPSAIGEIARELRQAGTQEEAEAVLERPFRRAATEPQLAPKLEISRLRYEPLELPEEPGKVQRNHQILWNVAHYPVKADFYTIGYAERDLEQFVELLQGVGVKTLVDVRADPVSPYKPEFSKENLARSLKENGIGYAHLPELGVPRKIREEAAREGDRKFIFNWYDANVSHKVPNGTYQTLERELAAPFAFMCVELDPTACHRHRLFLALEKKGLTGYDL